VALLRATFDDLLPLIDDHRFSRQALHGEPHQGNRLSTPTGVRWIDFEDACDGPREWDLCFLSPDARREFPPVDDELLTLLSTLNSARVATWCSTHSSTRFAEMRRHAAHHLALVRLARGRPRSRPTTRFSSGL
jgi:aminoglycoside/choline kinase family phosphotransferase